MVKRKVIWTRSCLKNVKMKLWSIKSSIKPYQVDSTKVRYHAWIFVSIDQSLLLYLKQIQPLEFGTTTLVRMNWWSPTIRTRKSSRTHFTFNQLLSILQVSTWRLVSLTKYVFIILNKVRFESIGSLTSRIVIPSSSVTVVTYWHVLIWTKSNFTIHTFWIHQKLVPHVVAMWTASSSMKMILPSVLSVEMASYNSMILVSSQSLLIR